MTEQEKLDTFIKMMKETNQLTEAQEVQLRMFLSAPRDSFILCCPKGIGRRAALEQYIKNEMRFPTKNQTPNNLPRHYRQMDLYRYLSQFKHTL